MKVASRLDDMDKNIVTLFLKGDKDDYLKLYDKYAPAVLGVLIRTMGDKDLAEECMRQAFCDIWSERKNYDPEKERLFTWILKIVKKSALYETLTKGRSLDDEIREGVDLVYATDIRSYLQEKQRTEGAQFASGVDEMIRTAIHLIYFESYSFAAAAEKLGIPVDALRGKMIRTIKQLKGSVLA